MPKGIVSKFCFLLGKCGQQVDIKGTIRDSYLFEVDSTFSFLLFSTAPEWGRANGIAKSEKGSWCLRTGDWGFF